MRLAAQAKGGFYPTPEAGSLTCSPGLDSHPHRLLPQGPGDPPHPRPLLRGWGGAGAACRAHGRAQRHPHRDLRRRAAPGPGGGGGEKRLGHALASDLFATSIANGAFGLLLLNPPYDHDSEDKRTEHAFLTHTTRYLAEGGLLVFIVPRQRLAVSARYLSTHYGRTRCWAFPDPEREVFDQVVLMAYRKADPVPDAHAESMVLEWAVGEPEPMRPEQYPPFTPKTTPSGTSCSPPAPSIPSRLLPRPGGRGCGRARR